MAVHKIPVAFGTGALVHQQHLSASSTSSSSSSSSLSSSSSVVPLSQRRLTFLRWSLVFSLSSPLSALLTYLLMASTGAGQRGGHGGGGDKWVQEGMLFSAGTFLYVTVGHILPELLHSPHMKGPQGMRQLGLIITGLLGMFVLASVGGHDHR
jgi:zinc transporter ZupT